MRIAKESLTPEFAFLAAMVSPGSRPAFEKADPDWTLLLALARRHRVVPALAHGLKRQGIEAPSSHAFVIETHCNAAVLEELAQLASVRTICQGFEQARIGHAVLKGIPLSLQLHGQLGLRVSRDIDLLVAPADMRAALDILAGLGFLPDCHDIATDPRTFASLLKHRKDLELNHAGRRQIVELHWRLFDNPHLMTGIGVAQAIRTNLRTDFTCAILPEALNLLYLALHGSQHGWSRLKWLVDFATLLVRVDPTRQQALYEETAVADGRRALGQSMILSADLLGLDVDPKLRGEILADRRTAWLVALARRCLIGSGTAELEDLRFGSTAKNMGHYLLCDSIPYLLSEARFDLTDLSAVPAHSRWRRLGAAGRLGAWLARHLSRRTS